MNNLIDRESIKFKNILIKLTENIFEIIKERMNDNDIEIIEQDILDSINQPKEFCKQQLNNGRMCPHVAKENGYCGKHVRNKDFTTQVKEIIQCTVIKTDGCQCMNNAVNGTLCGIHISRSRFENRKPKKFFCIHIDDNNEKCAYYARYNQWVCGYHRKFQSDYVEFNGSLNNHLEYLNAKQLGKKISIDKQSLQLIENSLVTH